MVIVDIDEMVTEQAKILVKGEYYEVFEANTYQWAEYQKKASEIEDIKSDEEKAEETFALKISLIENLIPKLDWKGLDKTELIAVIMVAQEVFVKGASKLGKKSKALQEVIKREKKKL